MTSNPGQDRVVREIQRFINGLQIESGLDVSQGATFRDGPVSVHPGDETTQFAAYSDVDNNVANLRVENGGDVWVEDGNVTVPRGYIQSNVRFQLGTGGSRFYEFNALSGTANDIALWQIDGSWWPEVRVTGGGAESDVGMMVRASGDSGSTWNNYLDVRGGRVEVPSGRIVNSSDEIAKVQISAEGLNYTQFEIIDPSNGGSQWAIGAYNRNNTTNDGIYLFDRWNNVELLNVDSDGNVTVPHGGPANAGQINFANTRLFEDSNGEVVVEDSAGNQTTLS